MIAPGTRVLDVGCAAGDLARLLQARGCDVVGIDINPAALTVAAPFCSRTIAADLDVERLPNLLPGERFDVVVFADVLEHLRDPWSVLDSARTLLNETGYAIVSVPNIAHGAIRLGLLTGHFDYRQYGILDDTHLRFFTRRSLEILLIRSGFRLDRIERTILPLFQPSDLVSVVDRKTVSPDLLELIRSDEDHETLQFVVSAAPLDDAGKMEQLSRAYAYASTAETEVDEMRKQLLATQQMLSEAIGATTANANEDDALAGETLQLATQQLATLHAAFVELAARYDTLRADEAAARRRAVQAEHELLERLRDRADDYGSVAADLKT